jgi:hypothetical protein
MRASHVALLVLLAAPCVRGFPGLWVNDVLPNRVLDGEKQTAKTCIQ